MHPRSYLSFLITCDSVEHLCPDGKGKGSFQFRVDRVNHSTQRSPPARGVHDNSAVHRLL